MEEILTKKQTEQIEALKMLVSVVQLDALDLDRIDWLYRAAVSVTADVVWFAQEVFPDGTLWMWIDDPVFYTDRAMAREVARIGSIDGFGCDDPCEVHLMRWRAKEHPLLRVSEP